MSWDNSGTKARRVPPDVSAMPSDAARPASDAAIADRLVQAIGREGNINMEGQGARAGVTVRPIAA
eukprot:scaffold14143_cov129-Isochrysis_galbana.AAC.4